MALYAVARLDDIQPLNDHQFWYRPIRHHFGITSFGVTALVAEDAGDPILNEFDEGSHPAEELYVVVSGRATFDLEGEQLDAGPGTLVYTKAGARRTAIATEPNTTILGIDGTPGKPYDATGWEVWAPLVPLYDNGQYDELSARLKEVIAANPQYPMLSYNLACSESLGGRPKEAIEHLRRAIEGAEKHRSDARADSDLDPLRDEPEFKALIGDSPSEQR